MSRKPSKSSNTEDRAERIKALQADLEAKVASLRTSDEWKAALDVAARFHNYSPNNVWLLHFQAQVKGINLGRVAGYRAWQKLGRQVKGGERGLFVLAPARYQVDDDKNPGQKKWILKGFTTATVFDISQTEGEEIPDVAPALLTEGGEQGVLDQVVALVKGYGFTYSLDAPGSEFLGSANGCTVFDNNSVHVRDDFSLAQTIKTSVHELAHVILHDPTTGLDYRANRPRCEVEAESVAYVVLSHFGITADDYSIPYVAGWSESKPETVRAAADNVFRTARTIIDALTPAESAQAVAA